MEVGKRNVLQFILDKYFNKHQFPETRQITKLTYKNKTRHLVKRIKFSKIKSDFLGLFPHLQFLYILMPKWLLKTYVIAF